MGRSVYSVVLDDDVVAALDIAAMRAGTNRSAMMNRLLAMLTKDEETLAATEALICTDSKMERWYVYYVEMELGLQPKGALGYLNVDRLMQDLMQALSAYSDEWKYLVDTYFVAKCEVTGFCTEKKSCGRKPQR